MCVGLLRVYSFFLFFFLVILQTWTVMCVGLLRVYSLVISAGNVCEELCEIVLYSQMRTCTAKGILSLSTREENLISQNLKF